MPSKTPSSGMDIYIVWEFIKALSTPFEETKAYALGLIDKNGKTLKKAKTREEKKAMTYFDKLIFNLKRLMSKAGFTSRSSIYALSVLLLKEKNLHLKSEEEIIEMLQEEIANSMGSSAAPSQSPAGHIAIYDRNLGLVRRGRPRSIGKPIDGLQYLKRTAKKKFKERLKDGR